MNFKQRHLFYHWLCAFPNAANNGRIEEDISLLEAYFKSTLTKSLLTKLLKNYTAQTFINFNLAKISIIKRLKKVVNDIQNNILTDIELNAIVQIVREHHTYLKNNPSKNIQNDPGAVNMLFFKLSWFLIHAGFKGLYPQEYDNVLGKVHPFTKTDIDDYLSITNQLGYSKMYFIPDIIKQYNQSQLIKNPYTRKEFNQLTVEKILTQSAALRKLIKNEYNESKKAQRTHTYSMFSQPEVIPAFYINFIERTEKSKFSKLLTVVKMELQNIQHYFPNDDLNNINSFIYAMKQFKLNPDKYSKTLHHNVIVNFDPSDKYQYLVVRPLNLTSCQQLKETLVRIADNFIHCFSTALQYDKLTDFFGFFTTSGICIGEKMRIVGTWNMNLKENNGISTFNDVMARAWKSAVSEEARVKQQWRGEQFYMHIMDKFSNTTVTLDNGTVSTLSNLSELVITQLNLAGYDYIKPALAPSLPHGKS